MRYLIASVVGLLLLSGVAVMADQPNLLIIHTDEHNFRTLGCYRDLMPVEQALMWGKAVVETPNIDWIGKHGAICTSFYASTPVCSPSRSSLMTGRYPQNTPVVNNNIVMNTNLETFAQVLQRAGYATGYAGKWHLAGESKPGWAPRYKGGFADNRYMFNRGHWKQMEDTSAGPRVKARSGNGQPNYNVGGADEKSFTTDFLADKTVAFIQKNKDQPWCFMVSMPDPHNPDTVRPPYDTMYAGEKYIQPRTFDVSKKDVPQWGAPAGGFADMSPYYGMVKCIDDNVGKMLDALRREGLIDNTIVVFTSDHGDLRGEHHRQNKGVPYEGSARIPFAIYCKGKIKPGTVVGQALTCVDFKPTVLALMGLASGGQDGRDASALLTGQSDGKWQDIAFMRGTGAVAGWVAAVSDRYKLICSTSDMPWLIDLEKDPDELTNYFLDPAYRQTVRQLAKQLADYGKQYDDPRVNTATIRADLQWAISGEGKYAKQPFAAPARKANANKKPARQNRKAKQ